MINAAVAAVASDPDVTLGIPKLTAICVNVLGAGGAGGGFAADADEIDAPDGNAPAAGGGGGGGGGLVVVSGGGGGGPATADNAAVIADAGGGFDGVIAGVTKVDGGIDGATDEAYEGAEGIGNGMGIY